MEPTSVPVLTASAVSAPVRLIRFARRAMVAVAALATSASAAPAPAAPVRPSTALVQRKCVTCHVLPAAGSRPRWVGASVKMHERRVALSADEWGLIREYLRDEKLLAR